MEKTNYILNGVGYTALLAAIIEQARKDANALRKELEIDDECGFNGKNHIMRLYKLEEIEADIKAWRDIVEADIHFNIYE